MTNQKTMRAHTFEVAMPSQAWWYWRCTCAKWGSGYRTELGAREAADGHTHYVPAVRTKS